MPGAITIQIQRQVLSYKESEILLFEAINEMGMTKKQQWRRISLKHVQLRIVDTFPS